MDIIIGESVSAAQLYTRREEKFRAVERLVLDGPLGVYFSPGSSRFISMSITRACVQITRRACKEEARIA